MRLAGRKIWGRALLASGVVFLGLLLVWVRGVQRRLPPGMMKDIRAGIAARHLANADERLLKYLEGRYGSLSDPAHREEAFADFFNVEHIRALQLMVKHSPEAQRQANIDAMARWISSYRASMSADERTALSERFRSPESQALLKRATAQYNSQDVQYRGMTAPVISQLLRTLHEIEQTP